MIEARNQNFIAGLELTAYRAGNRERQRRHVRAEGDFVGAAVEEVGHGGAGFRNHGVGAAAGSVGSAGVGVVAAEVVGDGVDDALRDLGAAGAVEECGGVSVEGLGEGGKLGTDPLEVERVRYSMFSGRHGNHLFLSWRGTSRGWLRTWE